MFLRHSRFIRVACSAALIVLSGNALATTYDISSTSDAIAADGVCTLREAIQAINTEVAVNECEASINAYNKIRLPEDQTYQLLLGALPIGGGLKDGNPVNPSLTIEVLRKDAFDDSDKVNPIIRASSGARVFNVASGASLSIVEVDLEGNGDVLDFGGLIYSKGALHFSAGAELRDGSAIDGGALYLDDNVALTLDTVIFRNNTASGNGGAIATNPNYSAGITAVRTYFAKNSAAGGSGGALYLDGLYPGLQLSSSTFYGNTASVADGGGAIRLQAGSRASSIINVTVAGQGGGGGISFAAKTGSVFDTVTNSVIVGNTGGSCVGDATAIDDAHIAYVVHEGNTCTLDSSTKIQDPNGLPGDTIDNNSGWADITVLKGVDGTCGILPYSVTEGPQACTPIVFDTGLEGFMPDINDDIADQGGMIQDVYYSGSGPGTLSDGVPTAVNAGSPVDAISDVCTSSDQRDNDRLDDCDAGSLELLIAKGKIDEFSATTATTQLFDPLANDLGDTSVNCVSPVSIADCMVVDVAPTKGVATIVYPGPPDYPAGYPVLQYTSNPGVHGVDVLHYRLKRAAVDPQLTYADADLGAQVNMVVEPAQDLKDDNIGSFGEFSLVCLAVVGLIRLFGKRVLLLMLIPGVASAAEITVNSTVDSLNPNLSDGICTLREALGVAIDESPQPSADCGTGSVGQDTIYLPVGTITLAGPLIVEKGSVQITGMGTDSSTGSVIDGNGDRIFIADSSMTLNDLQLNGGYSASRGGAIFTSANLTLKRVLVQNSQAQRGGGIFLNFNTSISHSVKLEHSEFYNNSATGSGGVLAMTAQTQKNNITVEGSAFLENTAMETGGVMDVSLISGGKLIVANSTFYKNDATNGDTAGHQGDAFDLTSVASGATVSIMNSTFVQHTHAAIQMADNANADLDNNGTVDAGSPIVNVTVANSIYLDSGACYLGPSPGFPLTRAYNVFSPYDASCKGLTEDSNDDAESIATVQAALNNDTGVPLPASGVGEDYKTSHFAITDGSAAFLVDAGNGTSTELVSDYQKPTFCRDYDQLGTSRTSGNRCDIGSFEYERVTAVADSGSNIGVRGRYAIIDVLANDVTTAAHPDADTSSIDVDQSNVSVVDHNFSTAEGGLVEVVQRDDPDTECGVAPSASADPTDCVVRYTASPTLSCTDVNNTFTDTFDYTFTTEDGRESVPGTVTVTIKDVPPQADDQSVTVPTGTVVVFPFKVDNPDGSSITHDFSLGREPINAKYRLDGDTRVYLTEGIVVDPVAGTVTYYPRDSYQPFKDSFTLQYQDDCDSVGSTSFTVNHPLEDNSGAFVGGGASSWGLLLSLGLLGVRRRRA